MLKLRVLEKVMQVVTTVSKFVHTVKDKIHEVSEKVEHKWQEVKEKKEEHTKKKIKETDTVAKIKQLRQRKLIPTPVEFTQPIYKGEIKRTKKVRLIRESNIIYLPSAFEKQSLAFKKHEDVYIDLVGIHSREPTQGSYNFLG